MNITDEEYLESLEEEQRFNISELDSMIVRLSEAAKEISKISVEISKTEVILTELRKKVK